MKAFLKKFISRYLPGLKRKLTDDLIVSADFIVVQGNKAVLTGWVLHRTQPVAGQHLTLNQRDAVMQFFPRSDVSNRFSVSSQHCSGFLAVFDNVAGTNWETASLHFMEKQRKLSKLGPSPLTSPAELLHHIPEDRAICAKFLKSQGFELTKSSDVGAVSVVKLDPEVHKIKTLVSGIDTGQPNFAAAVENDVLKEVHKIWRERIGTFSEASLRVFGNVPKQPAVSIIIPLYGRYDFIQHQIAAFSNDSFMRDVEVIYVLDDPRLAREVDITAFGVHQIFQFPFKLVISEQNRGFAGANNLGAEYASSQQLLLLNSDILPKSKGWLAELLQRFKQHDDCGIMGATLVYEDETVQHAGMTFRDDSHFPGIYMNHHPYKGMPIDLLALDDVYESQIVTGACMLMQTKLYRELGGLDPMYVLGDFEDSDLCLKVVDAGYRIYCSNTQLYHLERLSQDLVDSGTWKFKLTLTNGIYQMTKWRSLIEKMAGSNA
ncbi:glycosyltransferase family 2 protein [Salinimonas lutimaris]|uniref:glycosyltransferase family 2 protein n=1 Tax=Salinimonas lutimaris TaxID=914153 RepID=UPI0010C07098|nr:glycosyltransferase family 2 protein [Salinimonas lutimaris]